mmetsp:Transcript_13587/g.14646  ORF Transcript_13587/g.14646 Transcript_13587/m.14646 type:complete len:220 (+) Transcript_13587:56-715(+)
MPSSTSFTGGSGRSGNSSGPHPAVNDPLSSSKTTKEEQEKLMKDAVLALSAICGAFIVLKTLAASITVYLAMLPVIYMYGLNTCPPTSSFDAKDQLRMVFRGDALPDDHPSKPKSSTGVGGAFQQFFQDAKAVITSELATLPGYSVDINSLAGAALFATVTMPTADLECYWVGCNHRWYYWGSKKLSEVNNVAVAGVSQNHLGKNVYKPPESANVKKNK